MHLNAVYDMPIYVYITKNIIMKNLVGYEPIWMRLFLIGLNRQTEELKLFRSESDGFMNMNIACT